MQQSTRRTVVLIAAAAMAASHASATMIDQANEGPQYGITVTGEIFEGSFDYNVGQSFTVGTTGQLTSIDLYMSLSGVRTEGLSMDIRPAPSLVPEIDGTNSLGSLFVPAGDLANGDGWYTFDLTALNIMVTLGQELAYVLDSEQDFSLGRYDTTLTGPNDQYLGGQLWSQENGAPWIGIFGDPEYDARFRTYVTPSPGAITLFAAAGLLGSRRRRAA